MGEGEGELPKVMHGSESDDGAGSEDGAQDVRQGRFRRRLGRGLCPGVRTVPLALSVDRASAGEAPAGDAEGLKVDDVGPPSV
mmetsp:Transcript_37125/g.86573  ORF Transcript_37125/g.86573 Transcript_37125/m.86573 type:complete len:83 (+) Transcript_37125:689-937(+)